MVLLGVMVREHCSVLGIGAHLCCFSCIPQGSRHSSIRAHQSGEEMGLLSPVQPTLVPAGCCN